MYSFEYINELTTKVQDMFPSLYVSVNNTYHINHEVESDYLSVYVAPNNDHNLAAYFSVDGGVEVTHEHILKELELSMRDLLVKRCRNDNTN